MRNRRVEGLLVGAAALLLIGLFILRWDREGWRDFGLSIDEADADSRVLVVFGGCHGDERATVEETDTAVIVAVEVNGAYRGDCFTGIEIVLDRPLGDRTIIDAYTGEPGCTFASYEGVDFGSDC
ncbi:MAG: hypothetical protein AAGE98_07305 [Actinomycetota bacterium]